MRRTSPTRRIFNARTSHFGPAKPANLLSDAPSELVVPCGRYGILFCGEDGPSDVSVHCDDFVCVLEMGRLILHSSSRLRLHVLSSHNMTIGTSVLPIIFESIVCSAWEMTRERHRHPLSSHDLICTRTISIPPGSSRALKTLTHSPCTSKSGPDERL
jgi:hypothetical protein